MLGAQLLLCVGAAGAFALRLQAGAAEHPPREKRWAKRAGEVVHRQRGALGMDHPRQRQQHYLCPGDQARQLPAAVGGDGIEAFAIGILMDAFLVRTLLVPATVALLGRWNWWPSAHGAPSQADPEPEPAHGR